MIINEKKIKQTTSGSCTGGKTSEDLFNEAKKYMPGGVNSPVRAYNSVDLTPRFIEKASGSKVYDISGKEYIDFVGSWGPMLLGHNNPKVLDAVKKTSELGLSFGACNHLEVELAKLICDNIPHVEMIRMVNSGTEAVMSCIRAARGFTGRSKIVKFEGCYHGHSDALLVKAGSGAMTFGEPDSSGVTRGAVEDTLLARYNNLESVRELFKENKGEIACVILEPVAANMGLVLPENGFLEGLRKLCDEEDSLLIFDEVITGFRLAFGGAAEYFGIVPDLVTYGKIIGGGMPVGAYGGRRDVMSCVSPLGKVYQAGTLSGNPIAMAAGIAMLTQLLENPHIYDEIASKCRYFVEELKKITEFQVVGIGSLACIFHQKEAVRNYDDASKSDTDSFKKAFKFLIDNGIYMAPSQFESIFFSSAITEEDISRTIEVFREIFK